MVEFFTESKDFQVVEQEARNILAGIFKEADASKSDELLQILLSKFIELYHYTKKYFRRSRVQPVSHPITEFLGYADNYFKEAQSSRTNLRKKFERIGMGFGALLGVLEFGIASEWFRKSSKQDWEINSVLIEVEKIRDSINALNLKIDLEVIKNRLRNIAKRRAAKLSKEQQELLINISTLLLQN